MEYWQRKNYYEILSVKRNTSQEEIKRSYRSLVKMNHPDLVRDPQLRSQREEFLKTLNEAYEILGDEIKRAEYDAKIAINYSQASAQRPPGHKYYEPPAASYQREPPEILIRGNEQLLRIEYVRKRFRLKHNIGYYIQKKIIQLYTTPDGHIYVSLKDLTRARRIDADPETAEFIPKPACAACGCTDATLRERYYVRSTGVITKLRMRIRGGVLCSKCRGKEMWAAVLHNLVCGWWGLEAAAYNPGFIAINFMGGFRGKHSTKEIQERLRNYSLKKKKYEVFQDLQGWRSKWAASLPNYLVDQLLFNSRHTFKAAVFTILTVIIIVKLMLMLSGS